MDTRTLWQAFIPIVAISTLPAGILAALFVSLPAAITVFVVGWFFLLPVSAIVYGLFVEGRGNYSGTQEIPNAASMPNEEMADEQTDPIEKLRQRYARGEIDEHELERGLDALLETEAVDADDEKRIERAMENLDAEHDTATETARDTHSQSSTETDSVTESQSSTETDSDRLTERE